jgi:hypothetical protein
MSSIVEDRKSEDEQSAQEEPEVQEQEQEQQELTEDQIRNNGRLQLLDLQTEGKKYFKPVEGFPYLITFDRALATQVKGVPNEKFTNTYKNKDGSIVQRHPIQWVHEIRHENGVEQIWPISNKELATTIVMKVIEGFSVLRITKHVPKKSDGQADKNKTYYEIEGVS